MRRTQLEKLQSEYPGLQPPKAWLPINLSRKMLQDIFSKHWRYPESFNIDKAIAICTLIIIKRYRVLLEDRDRMWYSGFANIHSKEFRFWVDKKYTRYLEVLKAGGVIETSKGYIAGGYPKAYKFYEVWLTSNNENRKFKAEEYKDYNLKLKALRYKIANLEASESYGEREGLFQNYIAIAAEFDLEGLNAYLVAKTLRKAVKLEERDLLIVKYTRLKSLDGFRVNPKDDFGHRFHSPFTTMKKEYRKFIRIGGEPCEEIDIKNSQIFFFACFCQQPKLVYKLLGSEWGDKMELYSATDFIVDEYYYMDSLRLFVSEALKGTIYEYLQENLDYKRKPSRTFVKDFVFKILFSNNKSFKGIKAKMAKLFPSVVFTSELLNGDEGKVISMILQRLESKIMIDFVAKSAIEAGLGKFITVHDSIICPASQTDKFKQHIIQVFDSIGLPVPMMQIKSYSQLAEAMV